MESRSEKKPVIIVSTESSAKPKLVQSRATGRTAYKPIVVDDYNHSINGVDMADQYTVSYSFIRKSFKWWRKLFFWLFEVSLVNSYIMYKSTVVNAKSHLQFRRSIVESLVSRHISTAPPRRRVGRPSHRRITTGDPERHNTNMRHFPGKRQQRECVMCSDTECGARKRTAYYCKGCPSNPSLCPDGCLEAFHT